jgi:hypothetical protein
MLPITIEALVIVALVLSPGYVCTQMVRRSIAHIPEATDFRFLLTIITTGVLIHALAFPVSARSVLAYYRDGTIWEHLVGTFVWATLVCFVGPFLLGAGIAKAMGWRWVDWLLDKVGLGYIDRMPSAWDFVHFQQKPRYVRIHLKDDGGIIGGVFQDKSYVSVLPQRPDIYLDQAWQLDPDGTFQEPLPGTQGLWISHDQIPVRLFLRWKGAGPWRTRRRRNRSRRWCRTRGRTASRPSAR